MSGVEHRDRGYVLSHVSEAHVWGHLLGSRYAGATATGWVGPWQPGAWSLDVPGECGSENDCAGQHVYRPQGQVEGMNAGQGLTSLSFRLLGGIR